jgi:hypothetical protein
VSSWPRTGPRAWQLPASLAAQVATLATDLAAYVDDRRDVYTSGRPARWRAEAPNAVPVDAWLEDLANLADTLEALPEAPAGLDPAQP